MFDILHWCKMETVWKLCLESIHSRVYDSHKNCCFELRWGVECDEREAGRKDEVIPYWGVGSLWKVCKDVSV